MGRHVVGNLTTVSTSVRDFTVTILGYYFADRVAEETSTSDDLGVFLRWEQLAAYARGGGNSDWAFRGTERTRKNWNASDRIRLGIDSNAQILSDQKTYGLWGLYSVPSRSSGLVEGTPTRLTVEARRFVEEYYLPRFGKKAASRSEAIVTLLAKRAVEIRPTSRDGELFGAVAKVLRREISNAERTMYYRHLVEGGPADSTRGQQRVLAEAMKSTFELAEWKLSPAAVRHLAKQCHSESSDAGVKAAANLERVVIAESLLAPAVRLFGYLLASDNQHIDTVANAVRKQWGVAVRAVDPKALEEIEHELIAADGEPTYAKRWLAIANALAQGDYALAIRHLIEQNRDVMVMRGGAAPWLDIRENKLSVKLASESGALPSKKNLRALWVHSYFLDSLRTVAKELDA